MVFFWLCVTFVDDVRFFVVFTLISTRVSAFFLSLKAQTCLLNPGVCDRAAEVHLELRSVVLPDIPQPRNAARAGLCQ